MGDWKNYAETRREKKSNNCSNSSKFVENSVKSRSSLRRHLNRCNFKATKLRREHNQKAKKNSSSNIEREHKNQPTYSFTREWRARERREKNVRERHWQQKKKCAQNFVWQLEQRMSLKLKQNKMSLTEFFFLFMSHFFYVEFETKRISLIK